MTDRELLELAAKAGGYDNYEYVENEYRDGRKVTGHYDSLLEVCINPLSDDGDALRLAVKLKMDIRPSEELQTIHIWSDVLDRWIKEFYGDTNDPYAATRRAIVRVAAEIGKEMDK